MLSLFIFLLGFTILFSHGQTLHKKLSKKRKGRTLGGDRKLVIYGTDDRIEESEASAEWKNFGQADVMLVDRSSLTLSGNEYTFNIAAYGQSGWCSTALMFQDQATLGWCSGTLIGDKYVSTAGHCINVNSCSGVSFIFGATNTQVATGRFPSDHVYHCSEVVAQVNSNSGAGRSLDMAVVKLDQVVPNTVATPVPVRLMTRANLGERLLMVGHPYGLPKKYADGAIVNYVNALDGEYYDFHAPLDAFGGNSGSGVWSLDANEMVGILIEGATDYVTTAQGCKDANFCTGTTTVSTGVQYTNCDAGASNGYLYGEKLAGSMQIYAECTGTPDTCIVKNVDEWLLVCAQVRNNSLSPVPTPSSPNLTVCQDTANCTTDKDGDSCSAYVGNSGWCGDYDDSDFSSNEFCCACGGGFTPPPTPSPPPPSPAPAPSPPPPSPVPGPAPTPSSSNCADTTTDTSQDCSQFGASPVDCDFHSSNTFTPSIQCCACGGGVQRAASEGDSDGVAINIAIYGSVAFIAIGLLSGFAYFAIRRSKRIFLLPPKSPSDPKPGGVEVSGRTGWT